MLWFLVNKNKILLLLKYDNSNGKLQSDEKYSLIKRLAFCYYCTSIG